MPLHTPPALSCVWMTIRFEVVNRGVGWMTCSKCTLRHDTASPERPETGTFLPLKALCSRMRLWVGPASFFAWVNLLFCFEGVLRDGVVEEGGLIHDPFFLGATSVAGCLLLVLAWAAGAPCARRRLAMFLPGGAYGRAVTVAVCASGLAVAVSAVVLAVYIPQVPSFVACALGMVAGVVVAWSTSVWAEYLARVDVREALLDVSVASCVQWLPLILACALPVGGRAALVGALPVVWGICARPAAQAGPSFCLSRADREGLGGSVRRADLSRLSVAMLVFGLAIQFSWCFFIKMLPGRLMTGLFPWLFIGVMAVFAVVVAACACVMERQRKYRLELYYRATAVFCLCGVAATAVAAEGAGDASPGLLLPYGLIYIGYSFVCSTMWMLSLGYAALKPDNPSRVAGVVLGAQYLGLFAGSLAVDCMKVLGFVALGPASASAVALMLVALLSIACMAVLPERVLLSFSPLLFGMSHELIADRCAQVARTYGLTPREGEILTLLARGRDAEYISGALGIAQNTVNAHRKNIYGKLGVHSRQELLTLVERPCAE